MSIRVDRAGLRAALAVGAAALCMVAAAPSASAGTSVRFHRIQGVNSPSTPAAYDRVGVLETGRRKAKKVLILNPGTSSSAAYFEPLAKTIVKRLPGWQVWAVERRENLLEDHSMLNLGKARKATPQQVFDYYLAWLTDPSITNHMQLIDDASVPFARDWGMAVEVGDLRAVVKRAQRRGARRIVVGGHSLGGSITTAYATWDFNGVAGAKGLSGLVYIDGASSPTPISSDQASQSLQDLQGSTPWLAFGGIPAPFAGLFNSLGSTAVKVAPKARSLAQSFSLLPSDLKAPVAATNEGEYGYALDTATSPPSLIAAQAHLGSLAASGDPRGWVRAGELTPIQRYATAFAGWGLRSLDGTAWYHPRRLTIDAGAVGDGNANTAQGVLGVNSIHGHDLPKRLRMYAFGAALGGQRVLDATWILARQSRIPPRNLTFVNRSANYAHNDPNTAYPKNAFVKKLVPFLRRIGKRK